MTPMEMALRMVGQGLMWVDGDSGLVWRRFTTTLYSYNRPVGMIRKDGYVSVSPGTAKHTVYAHRLIWTILNGEVPSGFFINHINAVRHDNRLVNLELVTPAGNSKHAHSLGRIPFGDTHALTKVPEAALASIRQRVADGERMLDLAREYGVSPGCIWQIVKGKRATAEKGRSVLATSSRSDPR